MEMERALVGKTEAKKIHNIRSLLLYELNSRKSCVKIMQFNNTF